MKLNISVILLIILCCLLSCEKDSSLTTPEYNPKLIIHSFISPDDTILYVHVGTTKNLFGPLIDYPRQLAVKASLFDGTKEILFSEPDTNGMCSVKYPIVSGKEYKISAKCPGYPDVFAVTKVPVEKPLTLMVDTVTKFIKYEWGSFYEAKFILKIQDIPGEKNYFNVYATNKYSNRYGVFVAPLYYYEENTEYYNLSSKFVSDNLMDGKVITTDFRIYNNRSDTTIYSQEVSGYVLNTDEAYYKYHISLRNYSGTDDPFTEFSPVYSNVQGGYGVFGSYVRYNKILKLK